MGPMDRRRKVELFAANPAKLQTKGKKRRRKRLALFCHNLSALSGLRRLRQDLVNLVPRFEGRCSIQVSYGRNYHIDSKTDVA
jgi:hypothetical protein